MEMYQPKLDRARAFWTALQDTWITLFNTTYPTVAAINVTYTVNYNKIHRIFFKGARSSWRLSSIIEL